MGSLLSTDKCVMEKQMGPLDKQLYCQWTVHQIVTVVYKWQKIAFPLLLTFSLKLPLSLKVIGVL